MKSLAKFLIVCLLLASARGAVLEKRSSIPVEVVYEEKHPLEEINQVIIAKGLMNLNERVQVPVEQLDKEPVETSPTQEGFLRRKSPLEFLLPAQQDMVEESHGTQDFEEKLPAQPEQNLGIKSDKTPQESTEQLPGKLEESPPDMGVKGEDKTSQKLGEQLPATLAEPMPESGVKGGTPVEDRTPQVLPEQLPAKLAEPSLELGVKSDKTPQELEEQLPAKLAEPSLQLLGDTSDQTPQALPEQLPAESSLDLGVKSDKTPQELEEQLPAKLAESSLDLGVKTNKTPQELEEQLPAEFSLDLGVKSDKTPQELEEQLPAEPALDLGLKTVASPEEEQLPVKMAEPALDLGVKNLHEKNQLSPEQIMEQEMRLKNMVVLKAAPLESESENRDSLMKRAEEIVNSGLDMLRSNVDKASDSIVKPSEEAWMILRLNVQELLDREHSRQQDNQNNQFVQNLITGFQNFTNGFVQNFQQNNQQTNANGTEDEQPQGGFFQNFVSQFQGGVQNVVNNIQSLNPQSSTSSTVLGDTGVTPTTTSPANVFSNVISSVQQIFNRPSTAPSGNNQSDTGVQSSGSSTGFFQGALNQINQVVNNFRPTSPAPGGSQGDETTSTTPSGPLGIFQGISNQIGNAFNQANIFNQQGGANRPADGSGSSTPASIIPGVPGIPSLGGDNPIAAGTQIISGQIQQVTDLASGNGTRAEIQEKPTGEKQSAEEKPVKESDGMMVEEKEKEKEVASGDAMKS